MLQENKVIGFYSSSLTKSEKNYSIAEKEFYAVYKALNHFKIIIFNSDIEVNTDNKNMLAVGNLDSKRVERWKIAIAEL